MQRTNTRTFLDCLLHGTNYKNRCKYLTITLPQQMLDDKFRTANIARVYVTAYFVGRVAGFQGQVRDNKNLHVIS